MLTTDRYRPKNLLVSMMTLGPTEPTAEQLQHYIALLVDDLIELYENGVVMKTLSHPEGKFNSLLICLTSHIVFTGHFV